MPAHLKPCFVYCSMFPKDYEFDGDELVRLWMAQGYIQTRGSRRRMEDIGNEYFNDLQRRSFFDSFDSKFKMHDMIHDLAKSIAGNECWAIVDKKLLSLPDGVRHLYAQDEEEFGKSLCSYKYLRVLRTLLIQFRFSGLWDPNRSKIEISQRIKFLPLLRCLRTLEFCCGREDEIPDLLSNLKHLRYLRIMSDKIEKLPESICLLYHLQTLVLDCPHFAELPDGLDNLTNLRYLCIRTNKIEKLPESICLLYHLQTLVLNCPHLAELDGLDNLTNLRYLRIRTDKIEKLPKSICLLYHLQILILGCWNLAELPDGLGNLTNLRYLQIWNQQILYLPPGMGKLTNLQRLLISCKVQGSIGVLKNLVNLESLHHRGCWS
ncbi:putative disease resistance RPP13-like protein 1 isoform X1 [Phoenix dactylifera]|uniref:Disease resistance RPP13-like protein 1 isoform X1 n=1 Tax=Phoenix dactylifera TaxID=42345 RepID=A0A8B8ZZB9_PHODC|nr:putative disease resistance RPP13-like protein 1 isoform X1 [Phoenix dactylifera]XP_038979652.1 putative disease resistance RPP13-like protein 1 isoform X1 [Phoenix dactylifera]XP_038979657.1 putative disease resistance RPP13-like protein 1 isoform X1 [Phoenix dactylifera]XP_038979661.1 putative disease resistance RPP13-like protein 1 isoform X1 [Phoenix dactylifera]XP_038979667.1 putative disease resistance RPP13-like protein 1 isoform X1 [Phoenix dactylifera]